jgi:hypothetical protein
MKPLILLVVAGALAGALIAWRQPYEHVVRAKVETSEMARIVELQVKAAMRKSMPSVRVEADVGLDDQSRRTHQIVFRFVSNTADPEVRAEAWRVLKEVIAPHRALYVKRKPILQRQLEWIATYRKQHGDQMKLRELEEETRGRLDRGPSRIAEAPSLALAERQSISIAAIGGALCGILAALLGMLKLRDPVGSSALLLARRGWWWMAFGVVGGAFLGAALVDPPRPTMRALIEPAQLDRTRPVTWADTLAGIAEAELDDDAITIRWVHDLSPYLKQATLLEVIAEDRESVERAYAWVKDREDQGIDRLAHWNKDRIAARQAELGGAKNADDFVEIARDLANALERDHPASATRYLAEPWTEERRSPMRAVLGAALGWLAAIAIAALVGVRQ